MTKYQPRTLHSDFIKRPYCTKCGTQTRLFGLEPEKPGMNCIRSHVQSAITLKRQ